MREVRWCAICKRWFHPECCEPFDPFRDVDHSPAWGQGFFKDFKDFKDIGGTEPATPHHLLVSLCCLPVARIPREDCGPLSLESAILQARMTWMVDGEAGVTSWEDFAREIDLHPKAEYAANIIRDALDDFEQSPEPYYLCPRCEHQAI